MPHPPTAPAILSGPTIVQQFPGKTTTVTDDPLTCELYGLEGFAVTADGSMVYVADGGRGEALPHHRVRQIVKSW